MLYIARAPKGKIEGVNRITTCKATQAVSSVSRAAFSRHSSQGVNVKIMGSSDLWS